MAEAMSGPMPGIVARRWLVGFALCHVVILASTASICASTASSAAARRSRVSRASSGTVRSVRMPASRRRTFEGPCASIRPNSARCPRRALISWLRWRTSKSRARCIISTACCSSLLIGTKRMEGRVAASQMAAAVRRIVLPALKIGLDVLRRDQTHFVPQPAQLPCPEVGSGAGLQANPAGRKLREVAQDLPAAEAALLNNGLVCVDTVNLEDMLGQIEANRCNLHGGWLLSW